MGIHHFRTKIKTLEAYLIPIWEKEFMTIPDRETERIIVIFIITGTDKASAQFTTLPQLRKCSLIGDFRTAAQPGEECDFHRIKIISRGCIYFTSTGIEIRAA